MVVRFELVFENFELVFVKCEEFIEWFCVVSDEEWGVICEEYEVLVVEIEKVFGEFCVVMIVVYEVIKEFNE